MREFPIGQLPSPLSFEDEQIVVINQDGSRFVAFSDGVRWSGLTPSQVAATQALVSGAGSLPQRAVGGGEGEQPAGITKAVRSMGKLACRFGASMWTVAAGSPTLTQGYTGWDGAGVKTGPVSRTGMPDMLKYVPAVNTAEGIRLQSIGTNLLTPNWGGRFLLAVYVESQPGYQVGGTVAGNIDMTISTGANDSNCLFVTFNANQIREGWNFLKFSMRDIAAYTPASGIAEAHPVGVSVSCYGTAADANIISNPVTRIRIDTRNLLGATLYFDSIWVDWDAQAQVVLGCDGGINLMEIAAPIFSGYGWKGYLAAPFNTVDSGTGNCTVQGTPASGFAASAAALYATGWDIIGHTATHPSLGAMSSETAIAYQMEAARAYWLSLGMVRGSEFYASPQSSSSRLSEKVIKSLGYKLQRHARKWNVSVTPWGIDNPHFVGAVDMASTSAGGVQLVTGGAASSVTGWQIYSKLARLLDVAEGYGDTVFPFWHGITTVGDTGSGEDLTGDSLVLTKSAFEKFCADLRGREVAGRIKVCKGVSEFYYGSAV